MISKNETTPDRANGPGVNNAVGCAYYSQESSSSTNGSKPFLGRPLPQFVQDLLSSPPQRGGGLNTWFFKAARVMPPYRDEADIVEALRAATHGEPVKPGEIERAVDRSKSAAWQPGQPARQLQPPWPSVSEEKRKAIIAEGKGLADLIEASPVRFEDDQPHTEEIIDALFPGDPLLCVGHSNADFDNKLRSEWRGELAYKQLIVPSPSLRPTGLTQEGRESAHALSNTGERRFLVIEQDHGTPDEQAAILQHLAERAPLAVALSSGGKSVHGFFYCNGQSESELRSFMEYAVSLGADPRLWTRSQFVRMPDGARDNGNRQTVYYFDPGYAAGVWKHAHKVEPEAVSENNGYIHPPGTTAHLHTPRVPPQIAYTPNILVRFRETVISCGVVGEDAIAATLYLMVTSRLLDNPVSGAVKGSSSSGKSFTTQKTIEFFPKEAVVTFTAMSERALVYSKEEYKHRTIVMYEATGLREHADDDLTAYFVRSLLSEGRINYSVTVRDMKEGGFKTQEIVKEGPTNLIITTTKPKVHAENETRLLSLNTNDTPTQTKAILKKIASKRSDGTDKTEWIQLQQWLQVAERRVTIPFAEQLAELIPPVAIRLRRDFGALLALIEAHAILHQLSREKDAEGRIIATTEDYAQVRDLIAPIMAEGVGATVSSTVRETVEAVKALACESGVMTLAIANQLKLDRSTVTRRLSVAASQGYLQNLEDKRGKPSRWAIGDPLPDKIDLLPLPEALNHTPDEGVCRCAVKSEGYIDPALIAEATTLFNATPANCTEVEDMGVHSPTLPPTKATTVKDKDIPSRVKAGQGITA